MIYFIGGFSFLRYYLLLIAQRRKDIKEIYNMSKSGRYSADRKKIEEISAATVNVEQHDCGTIFIINNGSQAQTVNLPTVAAAGKGWWCKFIYSAGTGDVTIAQDSSDTVNLFNGTVQQASNSSATSQQPANEPAQISGADGVKFDASKCAKGDQWEILCDGTSWYCQGISSGSAALIKHDA